MVSSSLLAPDRRVERSEVAELHRDAARCALESFGESDDRRVTLMHLPKAQLVIHIQQNEQLVAGPVFSCGHARKLNHPPVRGKP